MPTVTPTIEMMIGRAQIQARMSERMPEAKGSEPVSNPSRRVRGKWAVI
jgi:hypothetical protein